MIRPPDEPDYLARHGRGGYLARRWVRPDGPGLGADVWYRTNDPVESCRFPDIERGQQWLRDMGMTGFGLTVAPVCACCGSDYVVRHKSGFFSPYRCEKHADRNPCAIDGCARTKEAERLANNQHICGEHWRRLIPPGSIERRIYHRFWRIAKRQATTENPSGWTMALARRFDRYWRALIKLARRRASAAPSEEFLDEAEIKKMFGWD